MTNTIRELYRRKSVRSFTGESIPPEAREAILRSAVAAPTPGNQQMYTIIDVQDPALRQRLAVLCDNQPFIAEAALVLVFCADWCKWYDAYAEGGAVPRVPETGDLMLAVTDACIAAQNAVTAAESLGIGSCYIGDVMENCEAMRGCLGLPRYVFPAAMLVFGYPTAQQLARPKPERCPLESIVCIDGYRRKSGEELRAMFAGKAGDKGYDAWAQAFCTRKHNSAFSREMSRSVREYLKDFEGPGE